MKYKLENLFIYPTWSCNLKCKHCWIEERDNYTKLNRNILERIIDEAMQLGLKYIKISGGEPLIVPDITEFIIDKAGKNGIAVSIETNGTLIDYKWATLFKKNNVSVSISLDSTEKEKHDIFRGKDGAFDSSIKAIKQLVQLGVNVGIVKSIEYVDYNDIDKMLKLASELDVKFLKINPIVKTGNAKSINRSDDFIFTLTPDEMIDIYNRYTNSSVPVKIMLPVAFTGVKRIIKAETQEISCANCPTLNLASILPNGDVGLCAEAYGNRAMCFGNVFDESLENIWSKSDILNDIREKIPDKLEGVCGECMMKSVCKGSCRVVSMMSYGNINSPHPICQKLYDENRYHLAKR